MQPPSRSNPSSLPNISTHFLAANSRLETTGEEFPERMMVGINYSPTSIFPGTWERCSLSYSVPKCKNGFKIWFLYPKLARVESYSCDKISGDVISQDTNNPRSESIKGRKRSQDIFRLWNIVEPHNDEQILNQNNNPDFNPRPTLTPVIKKISKCFLSRVLYSYNIEPGSGEFFVSGFVLVLTQ